MDNKILTAGRRSVKSGTLGAIFRYIGRMVKRKEIYDMHCHVLTPETVTIEFMAGRMKITPEQLALANKAYDYLPKIAIKQTENAIENIKKDNINITELSERFFSEASEARSRFTADCEGLKIIPVWLNVMESEFQGKLADTGEYEAFSALPGGLPPNPEKYCGIKSYCKMNGKPSDTLLEWAEQNRKPIFTHCSKGGIWSSDHFDDEKDANAAAHPISWLPVKERFPKLITVFCHTGGNADFIKAGLWIADGCDERTRPENNWALDCFDVADLHPETTYFDTGYHEGCVDDFENYKRAFRAIAKRYGRNLLFASDHLLCLMSVSKYITYVNKMKSAAGRYWTKISYTNPRRVLGLLED